jgi:hypothetical protein
MRTGGEMGMMYEPNKITATLKVVVTGEFYDDEASEETLRYCVEQDLEDAGFDVNVELLKEQEPVKPIPFFESPNYVVCGHCKSIKAIMPKHTKQKYCHECGYPVLWEGL